MDSKPIPFSEFKSIYSKVPKLSVDLVIQNADQEILLTKRKIEPWKDQWHLPGGTVLFNEPLQAAASRLAKKELGVEIKIVKFLGLVEFLGQDVPYKFDHSVCVIYLCGTELSDFTLDEDTEEAKYFKELPANTIKEHKEFLESLST